MRGADLMNKCKQFIAFMMVLLSFSPIMAGDVILNLQARVADTVDGVLNDTRTAIISLNTGANLLAEQTGTTLWTETHTNVTFKNGYFSVELGKTVDLTPDLFEYNNLSFIIEVDQIEGKIQVPLRYVPLSLHSLVAEEALSVDAENITGTLSNELLSGAYSNITGVGTLTSSLNVNAGLNVLNGALYVDNATGFVGIGTESPEYELDVSGSIKIQSGYLMFPDGTTINSAVDIERFIEDQLYADGDLTLQADSDNSGTGEVKFLIGGDTRMVLQETDGKAFVGIGVTNPKQHLEVNGGIKIGNTSKAVAGTLRYVDGAFEGYNGTDWVVLNLESESAGGWTVGDSIDVVQLYDPSANVGIGITQPSQKLEVNGNVSANTFIGRFVGDGSLLTDINPDEIDGIIPVNRGGTGQSAFLDYGVIYYDPDENALANLTTLEDGELIIGVSDGAPVVGTIQAGDGIVVSLNAGSITISHDDVDAPTNITLNAWEVIQNVTLDTYGHVTGIATANLDNRFYTITTADATFLNLDGDTLTGGLVFENVNVDIQSTGTNSDIILLPGSSGYVGIGVTSPQQKLDVNGAIRISSTNVASEGSIRYVSNTFEGYDGTEWVPLDVTATEEAGWVLNDEYITPRSTSFKVGIGTSAPSANLHVVGNVQIQGDLMVSSNIILGDNTISDGELTGDWEFNNGNVSSINTMTATQVGIGTDTPLYDLHVEGDGYISGDLSVSGSMSVVGTLNFTNTTIADGNFYGDWDFSDSRLTNISELQVGNLTITSNGIHSSDGDISITPETGSDVILSTHFSFGESDLTLLNDTDTLINAQANKAIIIEEVTFSDGNMSVSGSVSVTGDATIIGDLNVGSDTLFVDSSLQQVGIGVTEIDENAVMQISGNVVIGPASTAVNASAGESSVFVEGNVIVSGNIIQNESGTATLQNLEVVGATYLATNTTSKVGIGTTTPTAFFEIVATNNTGTALSVKNTSDESLLTLKSDGRLGIGIDTPTGWLTVTGGTTTVPPIVLLSGDLVSTPIPGAIEFDGDNMYFTSNDSVRNQLLDSASAQTLSNKTLLSPTINNGALAGTFSVSGDVTIAGTGTSNFTISLGTGDFIVEADNWSVDDDGDAQFVTLTLDKISIEGNTINATEQLNISADGNNGVVLDNHYKITAGSITGLTETNSVIDARSGRSIVIEDVTIKDGDITADNVTTTHNITVNGDAVMTGGLTVGTDFTVNGSLLNVDASDSQVGIGTASPVSGAMLQVSGDVVIGSNDTGTAGTASADIFVEGSAYILGDSFETYGETSLAIGSGSVGIGKTAGSAKLEIKSAAGQDVLTITDSFNNPLFTILENGNVGIGTANPSYELTIVGTLNATYISGDGSALTGVGTPWELNGQDLHYSDGSVGIGVTTPLGLLHIGAGTTVTPSMIINAGTLLSNPNKVPGAVEFDGDTLYFITDDLTRSTFITTSNTLTFANKTLIDNTIGNSTISGNWTTSDDLIIGDGGDTIYINASNWSISTAGAADFNTLTVGAIEMSGNTINSNSGTLNITASGNNKVVVEDTFTFDAATNTISSDDNSNLIIDGAANKRVIVEGTQFLNNSMTVPGNLTVDTSTLVVDADNNVVGIGTETPESSVALHVEGGDVLFGASSAYDISRVTSGTDLFLEGNMVIRGRIIQNASSLNSFDRLDVSENAYLATSGGTSKVGVNTSTPEAQFHVVSTGNTSSTQVVRIDNSDDDPLFTILADGKIGVGTSSPTAFLELPAGTTTVAPLKLNSGSLLSTPVAGTVEFDGSNLYYTAGNGVRSTIVDSDQAQTLTNKTFQNGHIGSNTLSGTLTLEDDLIISGNYQITIDTDNNPFVVNATNWSVNADGETEFGKITVDNLIISGNSILSSAGDITLSPDTGQSIILDSHYKFNANELSAQTDANSIISAYTGQKVIIEDVEFFDGGLTVPGTVTVNGGTIGSQTSLTFETAANKDLSFIASGTGDFIVDADDLIITANTFSMNGTEFYLTGGQLGIGTSNPTEALEVAGTLNATFFIGDGSLLTGIDTLWNQNGDDTVYYDTNFVGIGVDQPQGWMHITSGNTSNPPLIIEPGNLVTTEVAGAIEFDGTDLYYTNNSDVRKKLVVNDNTVTLTNKTLSSPVITGTTSLEGTMLTTNDLIIGDGEDAINISASSWRISSAGITSFNAMTVANLKFNDTANTIESTSGPINITPASGGSVVLDSNFSFDGSQLTISGGDASVSANSGTLTVENIILESTGTSGTISNVSGINLVDNGLIDGIGNITMTGTLDVVGGITVTGSTILSTSDITIEAGYNDGGTEDLSLVVGRTGGDGSIYNYIQGTGAFVVSTNTQADAFRVENDGQIAMGGTPIGSHILSVYGTVTANAYYGDGSNLTGIDTLWVDDGSYLYYNEPQNVGIGTNTPVAPLHIASSNGFLVEYTGTFTDGNNITPNSGTLPFTGTGARFMWYPGKVALRAGVINNSNYWSNTNIGYYSVAFGANGQAKGRGSVVAGGLNNTADGDLSVVGGGKSNNTDSAYTVIGGGSENDINDTYSVIGGGNSNQIDGSFSVILGGNNSTVTSSYAVIGGGSTHGLYGDYGVIVGGSSHQLRGDYSVIGGGEDQDVNGDYSVVMGGDSQFALGDYNVIMGGTSHVVSGNYSFQGGGDNSEIIGDYSVIGGGLDNVVNADSAVIGGGNSNETSANYSIIVGGNQNTINLASTEAVIGGGFSNDIIGDSIGAVIGGGKTNSVSSTYGFVGGGELNTISTTAPYSTILSGFTNTISAGAEYGVISGGQSNLIQNSADGVGILGGKGHVVGGNYGAIAGGLSNTINDGATYGFIGGGSTNNIAANETYSVIGGGSYNAIDGDYGVIGGGFNNGITGNYSTIVGGELNKIKTGSSYSTIFGGHNNIVSENSSYAVIAGGQNNVASGDYTFAAGSNAHAIHQGSFVWADSTGAELASTANNQFKVRASGGTFLFSDSGSTSGVKLINGSGTWASLSDRNMKENLVKTDGLAVLNKLMTIPIFTWNYKTQDSSIRHMGPMAQDFYSEFELGSSEKTITTVDADGVAMAAIQGLYELMASTDAKIQLLESEISQMEDELDEASQ